MAEKKAAAKSSKKAKAAKPKAKAKKAPAKAASKAKAAKAGEKSGGAQSRRKKPAPKKASGRNAASSKATSGLDKSVAQFRESLEQSVTLSRDRLQEVVDDAVKRGRMTRGDAEKMLSDLVKRGRKQTDSLLRRAGTTGQTGAQRGRRPRRAGAQTGHPGSAPRREKARLGMDDEATGEKPAARGPRRGELLEVEVDSLAFGGRGVARADGFVVFVAGGPAGRPRAGRGHESEEALRRGAHGRAAAAPAPTASPTAASTAASPAPAPPGRASPTSASWQIKSEQVDEALRRIGDLEGFELEEIVGAEQQWRYRNKLEYSFGDRRRRADPRLPRPRALGPGRRRRRLPPRLRGRQRRPQRGPRVGAAGVGPGLRPPRQRAASCATWSSARAGARARSRPASSPPQRRFPKPPVDLHTVVADDSGDSEGPTGVLGEEYLKEELCGLKWEISPGAFFQTNTEMAERLYAVAAEYAGLSGSERVFDLFCGIGTIGLTMAAKAGEVWGVEIVPEAIDDAERNAKLNGIGNAHFLAANARTGVRPLLESRPASPTSSSSTRRGPASRRKWSAG